MSTRPKDLDTIQSSEFTRGLCRGRFRQYTVHCRRPAVREPVRMFMCDLNWTYLEKPFPHTPPSMPQDFADTDAREYFTFHREFGNNTIFLQAYTFCGYAFYPTRLGASAPGKGRELLPELWSLARAAHMPFCSYFCVGADLFTSNLRPLWVVPGSRRIEPYGFLSPESPWTDLLCDRIQEFLESYPVDWLLFDWFVYGSLKPDYAVQPGVHVEQAFKRIIGRSMPADGLGITGEESLLYKRTVLAEQFHRIQKTVKAASPGTKILFNVPYWHPAEALWVDHPMLNESDALAAECTADDVMEWLLKIKKPNQTVWTTVVGRTDGASDPTTWRKWATRGCEFLGYAWGSPPDWRPHPTYQKDLEIVKGAFREMAGPGGPRIS